MYRKANADSDTRELLRILRESEMKPVKPDTQSADAIPYTAQDTLMTNVLAAAKQEFGADFNTIKNPMLYYPEDGDITLSGVIPEMNDAKFQFRYKVGDGAGCYLWSNPYLPISDKTIQTISKVNGVCKNWRDEISKSEDSKPSNYKDPDDVQNNTQGQGNMEQTEPTGQQPPAVEPAMQPGQQAPVMERRFMRGDDIFEHKGNKRLRRGDDIC
jgi:hypothetical protein